MTKFVTRDAFRALVKSGDDLAGVVVREAFAAAIDKAADGARRMTFTISTDEVDRMGDTIAVDGWQLENYRKNPVVLWGHDYQLLPVGKALRVYVEGGKLKAEVEFTPPDLARFNDTIFAMLAGGFLNAVSVGFRPLKYAFVESNDRPWGIDFIEQELLEFSIVTVPANASALAEGRAVPPSPHPKAPPVAPLRAAHQMRLARHRLDVLRAR